VTLRATGALAVVLAGLVVGACSPAPTQSPGPLATGASSTPAGSGPTDASSPVVGVPIDIEAEGFTKVTAFTIRTDAGEQLRFRMGTLENGAEFPPNHLAEHLAGSTKVRAFFRPEGADRVVYRLEDAEPVP
jgi:hypothetical protein